jgi:PhnB protein
MAQLIPYLTFDGNCREAMTFYKDCIGGELELQTVGGSPMAASMPAEMKDRIMHSSLTAKGIKLFASDAMGHEAVVKGNTITLCVVGDSESEIEKLFPRLAAGGKVNQPLKKEFFGLFGFLTDKFGIAWMFQHGTGQ